MATIYSWIGQFLGWLDKLTGNYVLALFLFALIVEVLMLPLSIRQQRNSIRQASLRPKEQAIRNKYKGRTDRATQQKVAEEVQEMYQKENFNQFSGCLPLLLQIPVVWILYQVVIDPLQYVVGISSDAIRALQAFITDTANGGLGMEFKASRGTIELINLINDKGIEFFSGIRAYMASGAEAVKEIALTGDEVYTQYADAVAKGLPNFKFLGLNLGETPTLKEPSWLWLIPVLTFVVYFFSMRLNRKFTYQPTTGDEVTDKQTGCSNTAMDITMPLMSVYITFIVPAAIGVYWIFKSILGTVKQIAMSKLMPLPRFTEEDYKAAEKEYAGKAPKDKPVKLDVDATRRDPRSLCREDDEDYVSPEVEAEIARKLDSSDPGADTAKYDDGKAISRAPLKDESDKKKNKSSK